MTRSNSSKASRSSNRATDISTRKDQVDQGISSLTAATNGVQSVVTILQQMQGLINTAKTETAAQRAASSTQFNTLAKQLNNLVNDTSYQGLNLINSTTSTLSLQFSIASTSTMKINGVNLNLSKLITTHRRRGVEVGEQIGQRRVLEGQQQDVDLRQRVQ